MATIDTDRNRQLEAEDPTAGPAPATLAWVPTEENFIFQKGEGRGAQYKVDFGDGEVYDCGEGDEAFIQAGTTRDMAVRNRMGRAVVTEAPKMLVPPEAGDRVVISGAELVSFVEDTPNVIVRVQGAEDNYQIEMPYDLLTKDED